MILRNQFGMIFIYTTVFRIMIPTADNLHYITDDERVYGFEFAGFDVRFRVNNGVLTVCEIVRL